MSDKKPYQFEVELPPGYDASVREAIASEIISFVRQRTLKSKDVDGDSFPKYSKSYTNSVDFKAAGKSSKVNLTLSGDMLANIELVQSKKDKLILGYEDSNPNALKAEGNQIGSYGREPDAKKARRFLGINEDDLQKILKKYPRDNPSKAEERATAIQIAQGEIDRQLENIDLEEMSSEEIETFFRLKVGPRGR